MLPGGFKWHFLNFNLEPWGNDPIWRAYFSNGWFNHQLGWIWRKLFDIWWYRWKPSWNHENDLWFNVRFTLQGSNTMVTYIPYMYRQIYAIHVGKYILYTIHGLYGYGNFEGGNDHISPRFQGTFESFNRLVGYVFSFPGWKTMDLWTWGHYHKILVTKWVGLVKYDCLARCIPRFSCFLMVNVGKYTITWILLFGTAGFHVQKWRWKVQIIFPFFSWVMAVCEPAVKIWTRV